MSEQFRGEKFADVLAAGMNRHRFMKLMGDKGGVFWRLRQVAISATFLAAFVVSGQAQSAVPTAPGACMALQKKFPQFKGKTLVNAINPHTPGYETIDPNDPDKYIGFDIDLGEAIGSCLGFTMTYKPVAFAALLTTLQSGQADIVISDIYATEERAKAADFITYSKVFDGVLVAKGNPKKITGIDKSLCGATAAENTGYVEVPLIQNLASSCKAAGKAEPALQLYDNNANCIQAILAGRADTYINDVNTVDQAVKAYPDKLGKAATLALPYSVGIAVPKGKKEFRDAVMAALIEIQKAGLQTKMLQKWSIPVENMEAPRLVIAK
ncbi:probable ABC transporter substrate-binding protein [Sulfuriferula multivorans]|uniref:Probable ABC transporter substrate-binding protein n=1 Tax=Sulfuriferula multivorans TaxID=1559896 RepID=A0A401JG08_9PROT|nr:ABC transporter substrate-binding protein [Sulfuriferula multivorans]GBL46557.1 probable ABC transporter substrate-binding protein [Sulfuriferula multivorans]